MADLRDSCSASWRLLLLVGLRWRERSIRLLNMRLEAEVGSRTAELQAAVTMRERAEGIGATLTVTAQERGTQVRVDVPLDVPTARSAEMAAASRTTTGMASSSPVC